MLTLVLGGCRSGKSAHAVSLAAARGGPVLYVATAEARDAEMAARIARHRAARPATWDTVEEPRDPLAPLAARAGAYRTAIVDCVTLWLANLMEAGAGDQEILDRVEALARWASANSTLVAVVANEVGGGLVPLDAVGRRFRDLAGLVNQRLATRAAEVTLMVAGLPWMLKGGMGEAVSDTPGAHHPAGG